MKLICCVACNETFSLSHTYKECKGSCCGGQYIDHINAKVWGDPKRMFVLGFNNRTLVSALREQIVGGDSAELMPYAGKMTPRGRTFDAFIIPEAADSVERVLNKFDPIVVDNPSI